MKNKLFSYPWVGMCWQDLEGEIFPVRAGEQLAVVEVQSFHKHAVEFFSPLILLKMQISSLGLTVSNTWYNLMDGESWA